MIANMNTYVWSIESLDCVPSQNGLFNIVSVIHWRCKGFDGANKTENYGAVSLEYNAETPFVEYVGLTEKTVIEWAKQALGEEQVQDILSSIDSQLEALANPPIVTPPLPWSK
jgi:hypothetical protein